MKCLARYLLINEIDEIDIKGSKKSEIAIDI